MPKRSEEIGRKSMILNFEKRRKNQPEQVNLMIAGLNDVSSVSGQNISRENFPIEKINISLISERKEGNDFSITETGIETLAESIKAVGLIDPIQVVGENIGNFAEENYYVIAGHRRLKAFKLLHENDSENIKFKRIPAVVYKITEDEKKIGISYEEKCIYITKEIEEKIYLDSNLEARQLSYSDVARYINKIVDRIENETEYKNEIIKNHSEEKEYDIKSINLSNEIVRILSSYNYSGWSERTIRRYLDIRNLAKYDEHAKNLMNDIILQNEDAKPVNSVYKECSEKIKFLKLLNAPQDSKRKFTKKEKELQNEWKRILEENKKQNFEEMFDKWNSKNNEHSISHSKCNSLMYAKKTLSSFTKEKNKLSEKELEEIRGMINELTKLLN